jgi:predicted metal-binding membrane protein
MTVITNVARSSSSRIATIAARPRALAVLAIVGLTTLGWLYLALVASGEADFIAVLCRPIVGSVTLQALTLSSAMWAAMVFAMMLPSAAPMVLTYAEIAEAAANKGEQIVSPFLLIGGYAVVWLGFAVLATAAQAALPDVGGRFPALFAGAGFITAGAYQFSSLKHACLRQCRAPFPFFFANWQTAPRGVFRLGLQQGLYCVGCCWAAMALMLAVGAMNILWMAALGILMSAEKMTSGKWLTRLLGVGFIAIGIGLVVSAGVRVG